jgi:hypothetical protein
MKWAEDVLERKSVDSRDFVVEIFTAETGLPKAGIYLVGGCVCVRNASYSSRGISDGFNAVEEFCNDDAGLATAGTRHEAYVSWFSNRSALLIR